MKTGNRELNTQNEAASGLSRKRKKSVFRHFLDILLTLLLCMFLVIAGVIAGYIYRAKKDTDGKQPVTIQSSELLDKLRIYLSEGTSVTSALKYCYPDYLISYKDNAYVFVPRDYSLRTHDLVTDRLIKNENGTWEYTDGKGKTTSYAGIDVSSHQGKIDWKSVAEEGVRFAMIRALYRGYESGKLMTDKNVRENLKGASEAGIKTGVYVFSQAVNDAEIKEEFDAVTGLLSEFTTDCPVVIDIEEVPGQKARADDLSVQERTRLTASFCRMLKDAGYRPMIYFNYESAVLMLDLSELEDIDKWYASYTDSFYYPYRYTVWQYSDQGRIKGISGNVDLDLCFEKIW